MTKKKLINYFLLGIVGTILLASSDFLMIYGDTSYSGNLVWLTSGVANLNPNRLVIAMVLAILAILFYLVGMHSLKHLVNNYHDSNILDKLVSISMTPWLMLHLFYVMIFFTFSFLNQNGYTEASYLVSEALFNNLSFVVIILGEVLMILPFIYLIYLTLKKKTYYKPIVFLNNPLTYYLILKLLISFIKDTPLGLALTNGLMSEAMFIFFLVYVILIAKDKYNFK